MGIKIYVDNEAQGDKIIKVLASSSNCPVYLGLIKDGQKSCVKDNRDCFECWKNSMEIIVDEDKTDDNRKASDTLSDLEVFAKMMGKAADNYGKKKLEKRNDILEKRCEHLKRYIEDELGLCEDQIKRAFEKGRLTFNDMRFLLGLPEVGDPNSLGEKEVKSLNEWIDC